MQAINGPQPQIKSIKSFYKWCSLCVKLDDDIKLLKSFNLLVAPSFIKQQILIWTKKSILNKWQIWLKSMVNILFFTLFSMMALYLCVWSNFGKTLSTGWGILKHVFGRHQLLHEVSKNVAWSAKLVGSINPCCEYSENHIVFRYC